jgi:hypothetical protein
MSQCCLGTEAKQAWLTLHLKTLGFFLVSVQPLEQLKAGKTDSTFQTLWFFFLNCPAPTVTLIYYSVQCPRIPWPAPKAVKKNMNKIDLLFRLTLTSPKKIWIKINLLFRPALKNMNKIRRWIFKIHIIQSRHMVTSPRGGKRCIYFIFYLK